ncbi:MULTISPECIES: hypothetical protein [Myxococcus]|uniref:Lipoprotein n=1 Tax=Myxococcus llanfairpwllgwyngyllgogerychwyrndrobwllllantysiliogogogochensis TaxID=2590453 RepID=A0A540X1N9_9BACT|nr:MULTISPECIES: hypothetical protein [Myxococcus]NTX06021.1 hypothetical protein [Myxococcus sp. CA040A]TQF15168.1 hypothetical protein FJV41_14805 [Myxococcus llanfairpwllgwyngyllgogerychwyrndrobwllllantysiliogogogochensis]
MKSFRRRVLLAALGTALSACASRPAPPVQHYSLGMSRADYRDYGGAKSDPCEAEPRWLSDELTAVNGLLARFVTGTEKLATPEAPEHAQQVELVKEAQGSLPRVLDIHEANLRGLARCGFKDRGAFPEISRRGQELLKEARTRLAESDAVLAAAAVRTTQEKWKEESPQRESTARGTWCTADPKVGEATVFYARQGLDGGTTWQFCDGARVEQRSGAEPTFVEPEGLNRRDRRKVQPPRYLEAAANFPAEEIDRPPDGSAPKSASPAP